ncbi:MAG: hypothetical protein R3281_17425 [Balneolaceae bacterium]|nr:hypothetical protein [Balneolaceae bacterium]
MKYSPVSRKSLGDKPPPPDPATGKIGVRLSSPGDTRHTKPVARIYTGEFTPSPQPVFTGLDQR